MIAELVFNNKSRLIEATLSYFSEINHIRAGFVDLTVGQTEEFILEDKCGVGFFYESGLFLIKKRIISVLSKRLWQWCSNRSDCLWSKIEQPYSTPQILSMVIS